MSNWNWLDYTLGFFTGAVVPSVLYWLDSRQVIKIRNVRLTHSDVWYMTDGESIIGRGDVLQVNVSNKGRNPIYVRDIRLEYRSKKNDTYSDPFSPKYATRISDLSPLNSNAGETVEIEQNTILRTIKEVEQKSGNTPKLYIVVTDTTDRSWDKLVKRSIIKRLMALRE